MTAVTYPRWLRTLLLPLAWNYALFMRIRVQLYARGWLRARRLPAKVISVGNLTVGGTGKTTLVLWLAQRLQAAGLKVAVLSRGYARRTPTPRIFSDGAARAEEVGDEPALLSRRLPGVAFGIAADRFAVGLRLAAEHHPDVFLLDDGFQHLRLARDLDLVVIDSSDPFGGGDVLPAGPLREPAAALARADVVILTRLRNGTDRLVETLRLFNPRAPVFGTRTRLLELREAASNRQISVATVLPEPVLAFCGIGNAAAFWRDAREWGFTLAGTLTFPDHHRYTLDDFRRIARQADRVGAQALLTTEKDVVNFAVFPPSLPPCYYARIEFEFDDEEGFWNLLWSQLHLPARRVPRPATSYVN